MLNSVEDNSREDFSPPPLDPKPTGTSPRFVWNLANLGLASFLIVECALGMIWSRDDPFDMALWLIVGTVLVFNTVGRPPAVESDRRWWVWLICSLSTIRFLALEYTDATRAAFWTLIGLNLLADTSLIALGRSFSLLPARRSIRVGWMYRFVRHPIYSAYIFGDGIYVSLLPTRQNFLLLVVGAVLFAWRASLEERLLRNDPQYREYAERTRWRFLPYVY